MADQKLSELTYATGASSSDLLYVVQGATSKKISFSSLVSSVSAQIDMSSYALKAYLSSVSQHILPAADVTYDLGSPTRAWRSLYVSGSTIYLGGTTLSVTSSGLVIGTSVVITNNNANTQLSSALTDYTTNANLTSTLSSYTTNSNLTSTLGSYTTNSNLTSTLGSYTTNANLTSTLGSYATSSNLNTLSSNVWKAATTSALGLVRADGTSITINNGIISSAGSGSSGTVLLTNGAVLKDNSGDSISLGEAAGSYNQGSQSVAIGLNAATTSQGNYAVAIGSGAATDSQQVAGVAIGPFAAGSNQQTNAIAIGNAAGYGTQGANAVAIAVSAGYSNQGSYAIAIGNQAAMYNQGNYSIAIGSQAGYNSQSANSIVINATGSALNAPATSSFTVKPIRSSTSDVVLYYSSTSGEITYGTAPSGGGASSGPTFYAYDGSGQSLPSYTANGNAFYKVTFNNTSWNVDSAYSTSTNRFTPQTAGYYLIIVGIQASTNVTTKNSLMVYKNGSMATQLYYDSGDVFAGSTLVYCNGSTDYIEVYFYAPSSYTAVSGANKTYFQGMWMRS